LDPELEADAKWKRLHKLEQKRKSRRKMMRRVVTCVVIAMIAAPVAFYFWKHPIDLATIKSWLPKSQTRETLATTQASPPATSDSHREDTAPVSAKPEVVIGGLMNAANPAAPFKLNADARVYDSDQ